MLSHANEQDGNIRRMDHANQGSNHVTDGVTLGDDEAVKSSARTEGGVEVACLSN